MALNEFEGTVMLVSHDRALLREVCDEFWLVTGGGVQPFDGDLDDYQKWLLEQSREASREQSRGQKAAGKAAAKAAQSGAPAIAEQNTPASASPASRPAADGRKTSVDDRKHSAAARQQRSDGIKPVRQEFNRIDNRLGVLTSERETLEAALAAPATAPARLAEQGKRLKQVNEELETLEARWLELSTQLDSMQA